MIDTTEIEDTDIDAQLNVAWEQLKGLTDGSTARQIFALGFYKGHAIGLDTAMRIVHEEMGTKHERH